MSCDKVESAESRMDEEKYGLVCASLCIPGSRKPVAGLLMSICVALCGVCGVEDACYSALEVLSEKSCTQGELCKKLKIRKRCWTMFCDHLVASHGIVRGDNCLGFPHTVKYTTDQMDSFCSGFSRRLLRLGGCNLIEMATKFCRMMNVDPVNHTAAWQAFVSIWIASNLPVANAQGFECLFGAYLLSDAMKFYFACVLWIGGIAWEWVWYYRGLVILCGGIVFVAWAICFLYKRMTFNLFLFRRRARITKRRITKLAEEMAYNEAFRGFVLNASCSTETKRKLWVDGGFSLRDFPEPSVPVPTSLAKVVELPALVPECSHPIAQAPGTPQGTVVSFFVKTAVVGEWQCVGAGAVMVKGTKTLLVSSGHVLSVWMSCPCRRILFTTFVDGSWIENFVESPVCSDYRPGNAYGASTVNVSIESSMSGIKGFPVSELNLNKPVWYFRRGVCCEARDLSFKGNLLTYKGDTEPGDSGAVLYQTEGLVAIHQGTFDTAQLINFASLGVDVSVLVNDVHEGYAEGPTGLAKAPKRTKKLEQFVLKAGSYDGNQFGDILDKSPWAYRWTFRGSEKILVLDKIHYLSGQLLFWTWEEWVVAGRPNALTLEIFDKIRSGTVKPSAYGKTWDGKTVARLIRLLGRKIYPVPEETGASATAPYSTSDSVVFPKDHSRNRPTARDVLLTRYYTEHAMVMPAEEWDKVRVLTQTKTVMKPAWEKDPTTGQRIRKDVPVVVDTRILDKVKNLDTIITREQFFDKKFLVNLYGAALMEGVIDVNHIPSIVGNFGAREVKDWVKGVDSEDKEWYVHYAQQLMGLYPESEDVEYDPVEEIGEPIVEPEVPFQPSSPPQFRQKHETSEEAIPLERFVQLETTLQTLISLMTTMLDRTDRSVVTEPEIKIALIDIANKVSALGAQTVGKTIAACEVPEKVKAPPVLVKCEVCNIEMLENNMVGHLSGIKHAKKVRSMEQPAMPTQLQCVEGNTSVPATAVPETKMIPCYLCEVLVSPFGLIDHCAEQEHLEKVRASDPDRFTFLGVGPGRVKKAWHYRTKPMAPVRRTSLSPPRNSAIGQPSGSKQTLPKTPYIAPPLRLDSTSGSLKQ